MRRSQFSETIQLVVCSSFFAMGLFYGINALSVLCGGVLFCILGLKLFFHFQNRDKVIQANVLSGVDDKKYIKKYKEAEVGRYSSTFLFFGFGISILSSIYAFDLELPSPTVIDLTDREIVIDELEVIPPHQDQFEKEKKEIVFVEPEPEIELEKDPVIELIEDDILLEKKEVKIQDKEVEVDQKVSAKVVANVVADLGEFLETVKEEAEEVEEDIIFDFVDIQPTFLGGEAEMLKFIYKNIKYPPIAKDNGIEGRVIVSFVVEKDGSIADAKILREPGGGLGEEAIGVVNKMPKWKAGQKKGRPVRVRFTLPVEFKLK